MWKLGAQPFLGAIALAGIAISWTPFHSSLYSYSISQPSSFKHTVLANTANQRVDYFFPSVGSFPTNVNVVAMSGGVVRDEVAYLKDINGHHIHRSAWLRIMGHRRALVYADFNGIAGKYAVEQVRFAIHGTVWQLTASYEAKFHTMRPLMLRMLASFRADN